ncbi:helicase-related protein [Anderseniella sp. Alg231-50]|uniref:helicase-related protein n=1 Tax=Anderseniella sp. Alg231-50 TaxID=1922226 RepID=UPI000D559518
MLVIDNINQIFGDDLKTKLIPGAKLRVAAANFSMFAYEVLKDELEKVDELQFIFTSSTFTPSQQTDSNKRAHREFEIPKLNRERGLYGTEYEVHLKNQLTQRAIARECADWIRRKAKFKSNRTRSTMQQFAFTETIDGATVYSGIQGFSVADLGYTQGNAVSNFVNRNDDAATTGVYVKLFEQVWNDADRVEDVTERLCEHIASIYRENSPERIYFLMLFNVFNEFLEDINEDVLPNEMTGYQDSVVWNTLYNFQRDAAVGLINKLETFNGCILADSVGLGKTFTALAVVKYYELRNKSVLVLCPKKLADNWLTYNKNLKTNILAADRLNYDVLCHTDLQRETGESFGIRLNEVNWGNYDLVVIDESHNFRNNDAVKDRETRYEKLLNQVVRAGVKTKVLMLSATPVNNRFNDLKNQLALAYEDEPERLNQKLKTSKGIDEIFRRSQAAFNEWSKLPPEDRTAEAILEALDFDLFELLDSVTIARSRKHITTYYDTAEIGQFPKRLKPISHHCKLSERPDTPQFNEIYKDLTQLHLAVYAPIKYVLPSRLQKYEELYDTKVSSGGSALRQADREKALQALMTTNLLKRLESSVEAFRITLGRLNDLYSSTLGHIETFESSGEAANIGDLTDIIEGMEPDEDDLTEIDPSTTGGKVQIDFADMDLPTWKAELSADQAIVSALLESLGHIKPEDDFKLQHLLQRLSEKVDEPINSGNHKVLVFTAFADTANYLNEHVAEHISVKHQRHTACVSGSSAPKSTLKNHYDFQSILTLFSPQSKKKSLLLPEEPEEIDILIGTDCISEGQNLQDCDMVINYDIHWNPVRIIQRFGRVDRIGSSNDQIQLVNYWPDISLDEYINLKERVENRMVIADVSATGDDNVLSAKANDISYRREQLRRMQDEVIELEDVRQGISITDLGLNDFRMDLVNYVKARGDMNGVPNGMHAVVPAMPSLGLEPGVIFTLRNIKAGSEINRQNRLHPFYLVYISEAGEIISDHTQVKHLLDLARSACRGVSEPVKAFYEPFNKETQDGRRMQKYSALLDQAIRSMIDVKEEKDIESLFSGGATTALTDTIEGLDDFELVAFIVVRTLQ